MLKLKQNKTNTQKKKKVLYFQMGTIPQIGLLTMCICNKDTFSEHNVIIKRLMTMKLNEKPSVDLISNLCSDNKNSAQSCWQLLLLKEKEVLFEGNTIDENSITSIGVALSKEFHKFTRLITA